MATKVFKTKTCCLQNFEEISPLKEKTNILLL